MSVDENQKENDAEAGAAADPLANPQFARKQGAKRRLRQALAAHASAPSCNSRPGRPSFAWVAATIMPPAVKCAAMICSIRA